MKAVYSKALMIFLAVFLAAGCGSSSTKELAPAQKKAKLYYNQGTNNLIAKDYTKALKNLLEAASLDPENSDIHNNLGMALFFKKSHERAIRHVKRAIELDPKNTDAKLNLASIYLQNNSLTQAESLYKNILEDLTYEGQHRTHYNLGLLALRRDNPNKAVADFKKALAVNPSYCPAHFKLAEIAFKRGAFKRAFNSYKEAGMGVCYNNPEPLLGQIQSLIKLNRFSEALLKLDDMQERFAMTKYEAIARRTILKVKALQSKKDHSSQVFSQRVPEAVNSLDF